jgi:hypothetical protein
METLDSEKGCQAMDQRPGISRPISIVCQDSQAGKTEVFCGAGKVMTSRNLLSIGTGEPGLRRESPNSAGQAQTEPRWGGPGIAS